MTYYCDYEALERPRSIIKPNLIPEWLKNEKFENILIPLCFTACTTKGNIAHSQDYINNTSPISFLRYLDSIIKFSNHKQHTIYFHNLYYDFNIILYELMWNDFTQYINDYEGMEYENLKLIEDKIIDPEKVFVVLGNNLKKSVGVNIQYRGKIFKIRDTFKILTSAQDKILKSFGYEEKPKIDFDNLDINDKKQIVELRNRNRYDVISLSRCIEQFKKVLADEYGAKGDTAASIALSAAKEMLGDNYETLYPKIAGMECEKVSRLAYNGGITQHTYHQEIGKLHTNLYYFDINSSYPFTHSQNVPYGTPEEIFDFDDDGYSEYIVKVKFDLIEPFIPCIRCSSASKVYSEYNLPSETYHKKEEFPHYFNGYLALTIYDIRMLRKYYTVELKFVKGFKYQTAPLFHDFITTLYGKKYMHKRNKNKVMELAIKIILNSLYGKFAQDLSGFQEFITKDSKIKIYARDLNKLYCPLSSYIVSSARYNWAEFVNQNPLNFLYGDTDSAIVFDKDLVDPKYIGNKLGQWGYEFDGKPIDKCKILGKKNYMLEVDGEIILKSVGLPNDRTKVFNMEKYKKGIIEVEKIDFSNFEIGYEFMIQKMHKVYGGIAMHYTPFTLKERHLIFM